jgi:hypothetical protein
VSSRTHKMLEIRLTRSLCSSIVIKKAFTLSFKSNSCKSADIRKVP